MDSYDGAETCELTGVNMKNLIKVPFNPTSKLSLMNCQCIRNKATTIINDIDVALLTETWQATGNGDLIVIGQLKLRGYKLYHKPRQHRGGGVGALINSSLKVKV